jgi:hypothetical protein
VTFLAFPTNLLFPAPTLLDDAVELCRQHGLPVFFQPFGREFLPVSARLLFPDRRLNSQFATRRITETH